MSALLVTFAVVLLAVFLLLLLAAGCAVLDKLDEDDQSDTYSYSVRRWHRIAAGRWSVSEHAWVVRCQCGVEWHAESIERAVSCHENHVRQLQQVQATWGAALDDT